VKGSVHFCLVAFKADDFVCLLVLKQGSEGEARTEPPYMFRPVQNPDDEEVEGRVRTRTRTKELVTTLSLSLSLSLFLSLFPPLLFI